MIFAKIAAAIAAVSTLGALITGTTIPAKAADRNIAACRAVVVQMYQAQDYTGTQIERRYVGLEDDARVDAVFDAIEQNRPVGPVADRICGR